MRRALFLTSAAVLAFGLAACTSEGEGEDKAKAAPRPVVSVVVEPRREQAIGFSGTIQPRFQTDRGFRVLGRLVSRHVDVGDIVTPGQILAQIDPVLLNLAERASEADLVKAQAQLANTTAAEGRTSALFAKQVANQADLDSARQALEAATAGVQQAQANLAKAQEQRSYATLTADEAGVVTSVDAEIGQTVAAGRKVMAIARTDVRDAVVDIPDFTARAMKQGDVFSIRLQADPSVADTGKLREIAPQADQATRTRRVRITLDRALEAFRLGATVTVLPATEVQKPAMAELPASAILDRDGATRVWVLDTKTKTVRSVAVDLAERDDRKVRIIGQLPAGARIVAAGVNSLSEGQTVKIDERTAP
ncbi:MAG: efflux transporter periplasmic adaptor subunit [Chelatococcus sp.]|nr:MAG: efflux transporter periplasmic adaptor subunit [Chelatococcus sp.]